MTIWEKHDAMRAKLTSENILWRRCRFCYRYKTIGDAPSYCRDCGKPLNEAAWEEMIKMEAESEYD